MCLLDAEGKPPLLPRRVAHPLLQNTQVDDGLPGLLGSSDNADKRHASSGFRVQGSASSGVLGGTDARLGLRVLS